MKRVFLLSAILVIVAFGTGCAITDYVPWSNHNTSNSAKLWGDDIAFSGFDPQLDGTYSYAVSYNDTGLLPNVSPTMTITSYWNSGFANGTQPAFNPDGIVNRDGDDIGGHYASFSTFPPFTKDRKWAKYFVSTDVDMFNCGFDVNLKQDFSKSQFGPGVFLCFGAAQEETDNHITELESFASLDDLFSRIWAGTLKKSFTLNITSLTVNGTTYTMSNPLAVGMVHNSVRPATLKVDLSGAAGKEFLAQILANTVDKQPATLSLGFSGGLKVSLPSAWKLAFNHAAIQKALSN
jgi:hypothetical protein